MNQTPTFDALYVHVPFCLRKCDYCAFYSVAEASASQRQAYLDRLQEELSGHARAFRTPLHSAFIGGGTPTSLTPAQFAALLTAVTDTVSLADDAEFSVECNPDSLSAEHIAALAEAGVTRVSLGVQAFSERHRRVLGRHTPLPPLPPLLAALRAQGITNINLDLIYAIPGQTVSQWEHELHQACALGVSHLSTYALTLDEGSALQQRTTPVSCTDSDTVSVAMWHTAAAVCSEHGLLRYEVSNLAKPGAECRHNLDIWLGGTYLGVGPAACSFDGVLRRTNPLTLEAWLARETPDDDPLPAQQRAAEILAFGLRTAAGWDNTLFRERTGFDMFEIRSDELAALIEEKLLVHDDGRLHPTTTGLLFADLVAERLL